VSQWPSDVQFAAPVANTAFDQRGWMLAGWFARLIDPQQDALIRKFREQQNDEP
jgi:hypothetical protein